MFLDSTKVKVFPSAYREKNLNNKVYDPEARLNSEKNLTGLVSRLSKESFVISQVYDNTTKSNFKFNIKGYWFEIDLSDLSSFSSSTKIYASIKTEPKNPNYASDTTNTEYEALSLVPLDNNVTTLDSGDTFYGLQLTDSIPSEVTASLFLLEKNGTNWKIPDSSKIKMGFDDIGILYGTNNEESKKLSDYLNITSTEHFRKANLESLDIYPSVDSETGLKIKNGSHIIEQTAYNSKTINIPTSLTDTLNVSGTSTLSTLNAGSSTLSTLNVSGSSTLGTTTITDDLIIAPFDGSSNFDLSGRVNLSNLLIFDKLNSSSISQIVGLGLIEDDEEPIEVFRIKKIINNDPATYIALDLNDEYGFKIGEDEGDGHLNSLFEVNTYTDTTECHTSSLKVPKGYVEAQYFNATSDERLKENIKSFEPHKSILDLDVVEFDYKSDKSHHIGCIAQDLQKICPEIVHEGKDGYLTIEESKLVYLLIDEVKKLKEEIKELKGE